MITKVHTGSSASLHCFLVPKPLMGPDTSFQLELYHIKHLPNGQGYRGFY